MNRPADARFRHSKPFRSKVAHWGDRVQIATGDFGKPDTFARAVAGAEGAFLMNGGPGRNPFPQLMAAAKSQGSPKIVFLSSIAASLPESPIGKLHRDEEDAIRDFGLQGTFIRAARFMSNTYQWIGSIKAEGVVHNTMGTASSLPSQRTISLQLQSKR